MYAEACPNLATPSTEALGDMRYIFLTVIAAAIFVASTSSNASGQYVITPSANQLQSRQQSSDVETLGPNHWPVIVTYVGNISLSVAATPNQYPEQGHMLLKYEVRVKHDSGSAVTVDGTRVSATLGGIGLQRETLAEMLAARDKMQRSIEFWSTLSGMVAVNNASLNAGRYEYSGVSKGVVTDDEGNHVDVSATSAGTIVNRGEQQEAVNEAAADSARQEENELKNLDDVTKKVIDDNKEHFVVTPGDGVFAQWIFKVPKSLKGDMPMIVQFDIGENHYVAHFDVHIE